MSIKKSYSISEIPSAIHSFHICFLHCLTVFKASIPLTLFSHLSPPTPSVWHTPITVLLHSAAFFHFLLKWNDYLYLQLCCDVLFSVWLEDPLLADLQKIPFKYLLTSLTFTVVVPATKAFWLCWFPFNTFSGADPGRPLLRLGWIHLKNYFLYFTSLLGFSVLPSQACLSRAYLGLSFSVINTLLWDIQVKQVRKKLFQYLNKSFSIWFSTF